MKYSVCSLIIRQRDRVCPKRKLTRAFSLDEETRKVSTFSTMTVVPKIHSSTVVEDQNRVSFVEYGGVFYQ